MLALEQETHATSNCTNEHQGKLSFGIGLQVFSYDQLQLFLRRRRNLLAIGEDGMGQRRSALAGSTVGHGGNGLAYNLGRVLGVLH